MVESEMRHSSSRPIMHTVIETKQYNKKTIVVCIGIASLLQWLAFHLLTHAKLGLPAECFALAQVFVVLLVSPYLAASSMSQSTASAQQLTLTSISSGKSLFFKLAISQIPLLCWVFLSTCLAVFVTDASIGKALKMLVVLGFYSFSTGAVGMWGARLLKDVIFGVELAYVLSGILIGNVFLLTPFGRYINNIQPIIQPVLHLNPLIAVCNIFDGLDIFRNPLLYHKTPITDYDFSYPPWYLNAFWQFTIGGCCFLWTWYMIKSNKYTSIQ